MTPVALSLLLAHIRRNRKTAVVGGDKFISSPPSY